MATGVDDSVTMTAGLSLTISAGFSLLFPGSELEIDEFRITNKQSRRINRMPVMIFHECLIFVFRRVNPSRSFFAGAKESAAESSQLQ